MNARPRPELRRFHTGFKWTLRNQGPVTALRGLHAGSRGNLARKRLFLPSLLRNAFPRIICELCVFPLKMFFTLTNRVQWKADMREWRESTRIILQVFIWTLGRVYSVKSYTLGTICKLLDPRIYFSGGLWYPDAYQQKFVNFSVWMGCGRERRETTNRIFIHLFIMKLWSKYLQHIGNQRICLYKASLQSIQMCKNDSSVSQTTPGSAD